MKNSFVRGGGLTFKLHSYYGFELAMGRKTFFFSTEVQKQEKNCWGTIAESPETNKI